MCPTPEDEPPEQACWFCGAALIGVGARRKAREHVFARWLLRELCAQKHSFSVSWNDAHEQNVLDRRTMVLDAFVAGRVCDRCNNGWMSRLEDAVQEDLIALAHGTQRLEDLDQRALEVLARWTVKTAFAAQCVALGPKLIPARHRRALCAGELGDLRVVGRLSTVDLGLNTYGMQRWQISYPPHSRGQVVDAVSRSYKVVLTVGRLVLAVCYWPEPAWPLLIQSPVSCRHLASIWTVEALRIRHRPTRCRTRRVNRDRRYGRRHADRSSRVGGLTPRSRPVNTRVDL